MKTLTVLVCGVLFLAGCAETAKVDPMLVDGPDYEQTTSKNGTAQHLGPMNAMAEVLQLTDDQRSEIHDVLVEHRKAMRSERRAAKSENKGDFRERRKAHMEAVWEKVSPLLTDDQRSIAAQIKADREAGVVSEIIIEHRVSKMDEALDLSDEQEKQLATILTEEATERLANRSEKGKRRGLRAEARSHREEVRAKIEAILDADQQVKFSELAEARKATFRERFAERRARKKKGGGDFSAERHERRLNHLEEVLELTAEQRLAVEKIFDDAAPQIEQLRDSEQSRDERREAMQAHREETSAKIEALLSEEQQVKFQEFKAEQAERRKKGRHFGRMQREDK